MTLSTTRLLYVSSHSLPYANNGYAVRTEGVVQGLIQHHIEVILVTRPGRPWSFGDFENIDIPVLSSPRGFKQIFLSQPNERAISRDLWIERAEREFREIIRVFKPNRILAASDWVNAYPAMNAAKATRIPFFYEVRGFWELSRKSKDPEFGNSSEFLESRNREIEVANAAQKVFTLNNLMKQDMASRGVPSDKIEIIPNATSDIPSEISTEAPGALVQRIGRSKVIGYIGAFTDYEGLDDLLVAAKSVIESGHDIKVLLVGSSEPSVSGRLCSYCRRLENAATQLGIEDKVFLTGRVSREEISGYYSLIDLFVIPRRPFEVCEVVSPIKPLEAFSYGKALLASNVAPLLELSGDCGIPTFCKGDTRDLTAKLINILTQTDLEGEGARLKEWVSQNRKFSDVVYPMARDLLAPT